MILIALVGIPLLAGRDFTAEDRGGTQPVAIIGEEAVTSPSSSRLKVKVRFSARVAAASWVAPSRPISSTSVAWKTCCVRLARISGQASASVARTSPRHAAFTSAREMFAALFIVLPLRAEAGRSNRRSPRDGPLAMAGVLR